MKVGQLDTIDHDYHHRAEDCCNTVWEQWLDTDIHASWGKILDCIHSLTEVKLACNYETPLPNFNQNATLGIVANASKQLKIFYRNERYKTSEDEWPSYQPEHFTSVALIHHKEKYVTTKEVIAVANVMHRGEITVQNEIIENSKQVDDEYFLVCKPTKDITKIFSPLPSTNCESIKPSSPNVILIEGAPGIGKTILSREIAFQWANGKLLLDRDLLFLIFLRDPHIQKVESLEQFLCYALNFSIINSTVKAIEEYLEATSGKNCAIVLDGYDEITDELRHNSFLSKLIKHKFLKLSSLVITSRPTTSVGLHNIVDRRVEILGFTKEDRNEYIEKSLKENPMDIKKLQDYLEANPFIDSLCYIPLNMTILICILKLSLRPGSELPKTQTEINYQFALITILRYLKKKLNFSITATSLKDLTKVYMQKLRYLSKLAFVFLGNEKLVFTDEDVANDYPTCIGKWDSLGLLKIV